MRHLILALFLYTSLSAAPPVAEDVKKPMPVVNVKNLKGEQVSTSSFVNDGRPVIISFWATWCKPCIRELSKINELYPDWQEETGVRIVAVSIDDARNSQRVAPFVKGKNWDFDVVIDENQDLKRAMNVNDIPHTFLVNGKGEIVWQHIAYAPGDEEHLYNELKKIAAETKSAD